MANNIFSKTQINSFAIAKIKTGAIFDVGETYESLIWHSSDQDKPTKTEFDDAVSAWNTEYSAQEYARSREAEYPSVGDQLDMLMKDMKNGTKTHQTACEAVKKKYKKP